MQVILGLFDECSGFETFDSMSTDEDGPPESTEDEEQPIYES